MSREKPLISVVERADIMKKLTEVSLEQRLVLVLVSLINSLARFVAIATMVALCLYTAMTGLFGITELGGHSMSDWTTLAIIVVMVSCAVALACYKFQYRLQSGDSE
jgi:Mg2+ and Co2+ transporter CorA